MRAAIGAVLGWLLGGALVCMAVRADTGEQPPLVLERTIALPNVSGRIDHMAADIRRGRLFVAELGNNTVDVIDFAAGRVVHRIQGLREPQGVGFAPGADVVAVANEGDGSVRFYKGEDLAPAGRADVGEDADNIRWNDHSGRFLVGYGSGGIAALDPMHGTVTGRTALPGHPEGFQVDAEGRRALVNVPDAGQIAAVDLTTGRQTASWRLPGLQSNFPVAWDERRGVLAAVFRSPARLALLDSSNGSVRAVLETCGDADDVFFDQRRHRIYISCGSGHIDVFEAEGSVYRAAARVATATGARTSLFVPELDRLIVAERAGLLGSEGRLLVFRPNP